MDSINVTYLDPHMEYQEFLVSIDGRQNYIWNRMDIDESSSIDNCFQQNRLNEEGDLLKENSEGKRKHLLAHFDRGSYILKMMKLAILMFCIAAATAGIMPSPIESAPSNVEADMEASASHHGLYERNIGIYAGALPSVYPAYPAPYYPSYSPGYIPTAYGYPYRPYPSYGVGVFAG
ncbi:uncharacterized protein LOC130704161 [Daphnia carinata]|uniref:uncharacterized protein LOC130704161 n=1 Tax=Daphnia carinata TaxID=120202 RepID=UPI00257B21EE|nr:uncharacterized protein LOC130704161 [Daphnia carinata]